MTNDRPYQPSGMTTSVIGSHARPGWLDLAAAAAERGELGPSDIREFQNDAVDTAIRDQEDAASMSSSRARCVASASSPPSSIAT